MKRGEKIKTLRNRHGLAQGDLADQVESNSSHLSRLENGKYQPSIDVLKRLAEALEVLPTTSSARTAKRLPRCVSKTSPSPSASEFTKHRMRELLEPAPAQARS